MTTQSRRTKRAQASAPARARVDWLRWASLALAAGGIFVSAYLTWVKLANAVPFCGTSGGCATVENSVYSEINGIPVAAVGLAAYLLIASLLAFERRVFFLRDYGGLAVFGLALTGTLYSAYLTYIELYVIHAICYWCVASAVFITGVLILSIARLARGPLDGQAD
jgi:uncharacterized membrane protein